MGAWSGEATDPIIDLGNKEIQQGSSMLHQGQDFQAKTSNSLSFIT